MPAVNDIHPLNVVTVNGGLKTVLDNKGEPNPAWHPPPVTSPPL